VVVLVLLFGFLAGTAGALVAVVGGIVLAVRRRTRAGRLRAAALLALGPAVGVYAWGMAHAGMAALEAADGGTDSSPLIPCRGEADAATVARVIDYRVRFVPLRFECRLAGGGGYVTSAVPGYVNPVAGTLGLAAVAGFIAAAPPGRRGRENRGTDSG
jgi:hypothetical protein